MTLKELFLALTRMTGPHGYESMVWPYIPGPLNIDPSDNAYVVVHTADGCLPTTMFSSHCDTADTRPVLVKHVIEGDIIKTDGESILGADDRMGVALMIKMMEAGVPGFYVFHSGEECGRIGSRALSEQDWWHDEDMKGHFKRCVAFDRRGTTDIITHQCGTRTCSDEFATALAAQLGMGYQPDPTGLFTDSLSYVDLIPECTNLSVGYMHQHTHSEQQDIGHAERLLERLLSVDWENLPAVRVPGEDDPRDDWGDVGPHWFYKGSSKSSKRAKKIDLDQVSDDDWKRFKDYWDDGTPVEPIEINLNEDSTLGVGSLVDWDNETIKLTQHCPHCSVKNTMKLSEANIDSPEVWHCSGCHFILDTAKADIE